MRLITRKMPHDFNLFLFGDVHEGTILFCEDDFDELLQMMSSPYAGLPASRNFGVHHGDAIEAISVDDRRYFTATADTSLPMEQAARHAKRLEPIKDKLLAILQGNHERKLWRFGDLTAYICHQLGRPDLYGTYSCKLIYNDRRGNLIFKHFATHGSKSVTSTADDPLRRKVNKELILKRHLKHKTGDCLLASKGHIHQLIICEPESELYLTDDGETIRQSRTHSHQAAGYIHPDHRWYVSTGSFLKLYGNGVSGYAEVYEYDPVELGFVIVEVRDKKIMRAYKHTTGGVQMSAGDGYCDGPQIEAAV